MIAPMRGAGRDMQLAKAAKRNLADIMAETRAREATVAHMYHAGKSDREIADALGIEKQSVVNIRGRLNLSRRAGRQKISPDQRQALDGKVEDMVLAGMMPTAIGRALGVSASWVEASMERLGLDDDGAPYQQSTAAFEAALTAAGARFTDADAPATRRPEQHVPRHWAGQSWARHDTGDIAGGSNLI